jgi:hypothetical protein
VAPPRPRELGPPYITDYEHLEINPDFTLNDGSLYPNFGEVPASLPPASPPTGNTYGMGTVIGLCAVLGVGAALLATTVYFKFKKKVPRPTDEEKVVYNPLTRGENSVGV